MARITASQIKAIEVGQAKKEQEVFDKALEPVYEAMADYLSSDDWTVRSGTVRPELLEQIRLWYQKRNATPPATRSDENLDEKSSKTSVSSEKSSDA